MEQKDNDVNSLERPDPPEESKSETTEPKKKKKLSIKRLVSGLNIYLLLFILVLLLAGIIVFVSMQRSQEETAQVATETQELTPEELEEIRGSDAKVGDPRQNLTIESNAIFSGKVLVRDSLDVAGTIRVGEALNLPGLTVSGTSAFDQVTANGLSVSGDASIQGQVNIQENLAVTGSATFGSTVSAPEINIGALRITNDLSFGRHLDAGGGTPTKTDGSAVGSGGTTSLSGTDTAGTLTVNTGGSPGAGCFATIRFSQPFNGSPHITITPVGSAAAAVNYYITRSTTTFSICAANNPPAGSSFSFDWLAID